MIVVASFNYYGPPSSAPLVVATVLAVVILWFLSYRSPAVGFLGGAISWGLIAFVVFGGGSGDMTGFVQFVGAEIFAMIGAVAGSVAELLGRLRKSTRHPPEDKVANFSARVANCRLCQILFGLQRKSSRPAALNDSDNR